MLGSIRNFSKSFLAKIFVAIIALPFVLWGMGDVFTSGKQNVLVEINDEKISSKEFITYIQKIELTKKDIESMGKSQIFDEMLTNYISEKIINIESKKKGLQLTDTGLGQILIKDKTFEKDNEFSRTKYEKFLLQNGYTAATYERFLKDIEIKGQLLNFYSGGIKLPEFITNELYEKENKIKEIEYLNLNNIYAKKIIEEKEIQEFYKKNKSLFEERFISFEYLELKPDILTKKKEYDEDYYEKLDELENDILDGRSFVDITSGNEKSIKKINLVNSRKIKKDGNTIKDIDDKLFQKIFSIKEVEIPQFINIQNKYYLAKIIEEKNIILTLQDKDLRKTIELQLKIRFKIDENKKLIDKISSNNFNKNQMNQFAQENNLTIEKIKINGIKDTKKFSEDLLIKIYNYNIDEIFVLSDNIIQKNFLVRINKETKPLINKKSDEYKKYYKKANAQYIAKIYKSYDKYINENYKIDINQRVLERLKNSF